MNYPSNFGIGILMLFILELGSSCGGSSNSNHQTDTDNNVCGGAPCILECPDQTCQSYLGSYRFTNASSGLLAEVHGQVIITHRTDGEILYNFVLQGQSSLSPQSSDNNVLAIAFNKDKILPILVTIQAIGYQDFSQSFDLAIDINSAHQMCSTVCYESTQQLEISLQPK